jgi:hypothetical protein
MEVVFALGLNYAAVFFDNDQVAWRIQGNRLLSHRLTIETENLLQANRTHMFLRFHIGHILMDQEYWIPGAWGYRSCQMPSISP